MALTDPGALDDPVVSCVDPRSEVLVRDDIGRQVAAGADDNGTARHAKKPS
jgi:hypothetical protein